MKRAITILTFLSNTIAQENDPEEIPEGGIVKEVSTSVVSGDGYTSETTYGEYLTMSEDARVLYMFIRSKISGIDMPTNKWVVFYT